MASDYFSKLPAINLQMSAAEIKEKYENMVKSSPDFKKSYNNFLSGSFTNLFMSELIHIMKSFVDRAEIAMNNHFPSTVSNEDASYAVLDVAGYSIQGTEAAEAEISLYFSAIPGDSYIEFTPPYSLVALDLDGNSTTFELIRKENDEFLYLDSDVITITTTPSTLELQDDGTYKYNSTISMYSGVTGSYTYTALGTDGESVTLTLDEDVQVKSFRCYKYDSEEETYTSMVKTDNFITEDYESDDYDDENVIPYMITKDSSKKYTIHFGPSAYVEGKVPNEGDIFVIYYRTGGGESDNILSGAIDSEKDIIVDSERITIRFTNESDCEGGKNSDAALDLIMANVQKQKTLAVSNRYKKKQEEDYAIILKDEGTVKNSVSYGIKQFNDGDIGNEEELMHSNDVFTYIVPNDDFTAYESMAAVESAMKLDLYKNFYTNLEFTFSQLQLYGTEDTNYYYHLPKHHIRWRFADSVFTYDLFITTEKITRKSDVSNIYDDVYSFNYGLIPSEFVSSADYSVMCKDGEYYIKAGGGLSTTATYYLHYVKLDHSEYCYNEMNGFYVVDDGEETEHLQAIVVHNVVYHDSENVYSMKITSTPTDTENYDDIDSDYGFDESDVFDLEYDSATDTTYVNVYDTWDNYATLKAAIDNPSTNKFYFHYLRVSETDVNNSVANAENDEDSLVSYLDDFSMLKVDDYIKETVLFPFTVKVRVYMKENVFVTTTNMEKLVGDALRAAYNVNVVDYGDNVYLSDISAVIRDSSDYIKYIVIDYFGASYDKREDDTYFENQTEKLSVPYNALGIVNFDEYSGIEQVEGVIVSVYTTSEDD